MNAPVTVPREIVLASAGSGKTFHISSRLIGLLAYGEEPDRILAATFTRKAAGEILGRVLKRLAEAATDPRHARALAGYATFPGGGSHPPLPEFWAGVLERVVDSLHRFDVGTLDAFFIRAASAFAPEVGLPPDWRIPDMPSVQRLRAEALLGVLRSVDRPRLIELLRLSARGDARRSVHDRLGRMMEGLINVAEQIDPDAREPWRAFLRGAERDPVSHADPDDLARSLDTVDVPLTQAGMRRKSWEKALAQISGALRDRDWEAILKFTLCQRAANGVHEFDGALIGADLRAILEDVVDATRAELRPRLGRQVDALGELTSEFEERYRALQRSSGLYTFTDVTRLIGEAGPLGHRQDLYYRLDARTRHVLLDEFQDTSLQQWEVLQPIVDEVLSDDGRAAVLVADPKQSIYGWRGAEPSLVHAVQRHYDLEQETLARSYRSSRTVLDFVNRVFGDVATNPVLAGDDVCRDTAEAWTADFEPHQAVNDLPGYVSIEVGPADTGRDRSRPQLYRYAARRVSELTVACPGYTIGVLTRTNDAVARLYVELRRLGVEVSQEGGTPLTDSPACEAMVALLRLADHPGDTIARYHVARSPLGDVVQLADHTDTGAAERLSRRIRRDLLANGYGPTIARWAQRIAPSADRRDARRLFQLTELAHRYDDRATLRPSDFIRLVETERIEDRTTAGTRVMTIHQAKGLEFDIVVLPQLDDSIFTGGRPPPVAVYRAERGGPVTAVLPGAGKELHCIFPELAAAARQRKAAIVRDALSTLYVGLTRVRYAQYAILSPDGPKGQGTAVSPARILRAALAGTKVGPAATAGIRLFEMGSPEWHLDPRAVPEGDVDAERAELAAPAPPRAPEPVGRVVRRRTPSDLHDEPVLVREILRIDNAEALDRGSIVHAWFERIAWIDDPEPLDAELLDAAQRVAPGLPPQRTEEMLAEFRTWTRSPAIRAMLSRGRYGGDSRELVVERELPFMRRIGDTLMEGVIDRVVLVRESGAIVSAEIIDYKTDRIAAEEKKIAAFRDRYRNQLSAYADAVAELYGVPRDRCSGTLVLLEQHRAIGVDLSPVRRAPVQLTLEGLDLDPSPRTS